MERANSNSASKRLRAMSHRVSIFPYPAQFPLSVDLDQA
ncbi:hypothetical protein BN1221_00197c [Brenneria goodwinii]|uniref:Uncharacterized protein n=1 Tax=Brenneria goodwinii TaxID=1109412 RepID=A0A0G4JPH0_9GAMM|nr:hypothetical protein BN1221_00197c [Brenneria goodwinii]